MSPNMRPIAAAIRSTGIAPRPHQTADEHGQEAVGFITISRQAGAGGTTLARALQEALNGRGQTEPPWRAFDRNLVEQIAQDKSIPSHVVDSLEDHSHSWLKDLLTGLWVNEPNAEELTLYRAVAAAIAALAREGHAIIVGRGGVFVTAHIPGGLHLQLVAPLEARVQHMAELRDVCEDEARKLVKTIDENRQAFYRRYWPRVQKGSDLFTATFNTAQLSEEQIVNMVLALMPSAASGRKWQTGRPFSHLL